MKYSHLQVKSKIKKSLSKYTECVSQKRLFTVHLGLHVYVIPFLKSVNTSLFI